MILWYNALMGIDLFPEGIPVSKRLFDLLVTIPILALTLPVMGIIALVVWTVEGRPVLFSQERPGYRARIFRVYKFRTMRSTRDVHGNLLPDEMRLSRLGGFLRSTSLDELPELFAVLCGQMSLVGPRPLLVRYLNRYSPEQARRHDALPGMTGWAQINGRNALDWEERFRLDVWYVDHWSFLLDVKILFLTLGKVIRREGINQPGRATADEFMGSSEN